MEELKFITEVSYLVSHIFCTEKVYIYNIN